MQLRAATIDAGDIWLSSIDVAAPDFSTTSTEAFAPVTLDEIEKRHIERTLEHTDWNKSQAAQILGIERSTLDRKIRRYDLTARRP